MQFSYLYFYMGKISLMPLPFVEQRQFYLAFPAAAQFGGKYPFIMIQELPLCSQTNHIVLIHGD